MFQVIEDVSDVLEGNLIYSEKEHSFDSLPPLNSDITFLLEDNVCRLQFKESFIDTSLGIFPK